MELKEVPTEDLIKELYKRADENIGAVIHWLDDKLYKRRMCYDC